jgi:hypothetical protein
VPEAKKSPGRRTVARTAASSLVIEDIDAVHVAHGSMRVSIQHATLGHHGNGYGRLVKMFVSAVLPRKAPLALRRRPVFGRSAADVTHVTLGKLALSELLKAMSIERSRLRRNVKEQELPKLPHGSVMRPSLSRLRSHPWPLGPRDKDRHGCTAVLVASPNFISNSGPHFRLQWP